MKKTILEGIIKSSNKEEAVSKTLDTLNKSESKIRIIAAVAVGVGYFAYDTYRSKKIDADILKELCDETSKKL